MRAGFRNRVHQIIIIQTRKRQTCSTVTLISNTIYTQYIVRRAHRTQSKSAIGLVSGVKSLTELKSELDIDRFTLL